MKQESYEKGLKTANRLIELGWDINKIEFGYDGFSLIARKLYAEITVSFNYEDYLYVGENNHHNSSFSFNCYHLDFDEVLKTILPKAIVSFSHETYKLVAVNEYGNDYGKDRFDTTYFGTEADTIHWLCDDGNHQRTELDNENLFSFKFFKQTYPNENIYKTTEKVEFNQNTDENCFRFSKKAMKFKVIEYVRKNAESDFVKTREYYEYVDFCED